MNIFVISLLVGYVMTFIYLEVSQVVRVKRICNNYKIRVYMLHHHFNDYLKLPDQSEMLHIKHIFKTDVKSWLKYTVNK